MSKNILSRKLFIYEYPNYGIQSKYYMVKYKEFIMPLVFL